MYSVSSRGLGRRRRFAMTAFPLYLHGNEIGHPASFRHCECRIGYTEKPRSSSLYASLELCLTDSATSTDSFWTIRGTLNGLPRHPMCEAGGKSSPTTDSPVTPAARWRLRSPLGRT